MKNVSFLLTGSDADNTGNWTIGNLYGTNSAPTFPGFTVTPVVNTFGTLLTGVQYEIVF